jgi:hypothetical protein
MIEVPCPSIFLYGADHGAWLQPGNFIIHDLTPM